MLETTCSLSVVIPVLNEAATLRELLERVEQVQIEKEIVVVDDGSSDSTPQIAEHFAAEHANVTVLHHPVPRGKGSALGTGFSICRGCYVIVQGADLEYDPADYARLLAVVESGAAEVAYGLRQARWETMTPLQRWGNWAVNWVCNRLYGSRLTDLQTCYKLIPRALLEQIKLDSSGFEIDPELTAKILRRGWRIQEVPIQYTTRTYEQGKKVRWTDGVRALLTLVKYHFT